MNDNFFEKYAIEYTNILKDMTKYGADKHFETESYRDLPLLIQYLSYHKIKATDKSKELYTNITTFINEIKEKSENDLVYWFNSISNFSSFLRFAEKCYMYKNSEDNNVYTDIDKNGDKQNLYIIYNDYKIKITFTKTKIPNINKSSLLDLNENKVIFIDIEIVRTFGKRMNNVFKFIIGEEPKFNDISDELLFYKFKNDINSIIVDTYSNILQSILYNMVISSNCYRFESVWWEEILTNGLWVEKNKKKKIIKEIRC